MRDIVRPSLASRPMSLSLAVYSCSLRAVKTNSCSLLDSPVRSLLGRQRQLFKVICTTNRRADTGTFHREFHPQEQLAREDPMAAAPATVACTHSSVARPLRQGRPAPRVGPQSIARNTRGNGWHDTLAGQFFHEQIQEARFHQIQRRSPDQHFSLERRVARLTQAASS